MSKVKRVSPEAIKRLIYPRSVAVVGASDTSPYPGVEAMIERGLEVYPINPTRATVHGCRAYPSLDALANPVDAVFSVVNSQLSVRTVSEAARLGVGGVILYASGFDEGARAALVTAAADRMAVLGPNCLGLINVRAGMYMTAAPLDDCPQGGVGYLSHPGGLLLSAVNGARARGIGFSHLITCGEELITDIADYLDVLIDDDDTKVIAVVLETIRRPQAFFAAAARARGAGKPIVALKLGKGVRAQAIARSHTGAIAGEPWVYEAAFRQAGIISARDFSDLLDQVALFDQLPVQRWSSMGGVAVLSTSGGMAELASDLCEQEGVRLPEVTTLKPELEKLLEEAGGLQSAAGVVNPMDLGASITARPGLIARAVSLYSAAAEIDTLLFVHVLDTAGERMGRHLLEEFARPETTSGIRFVLASLEDGEMAPWTADCKPRGIATGRGLRAAVRGIRAMQQFGELQRFRSDPPQRSKALHEAPTAASVRTEVGPILPFAAAMTLLKSFGIPTAPYQIIAPEQPLPVNVSFAGPYTVKLADVPHRTEVGAVDLGIEKPALSRSIQRLRALAVALDAPGCVVVQPYLSFDGEAFFGVQSDADLGPMVVCGVGGTLVELLQQLAARLAPFGLAEANRMVGELDPRITAGFRGARPWNMDELAGHAVALSDLAVGCRQWLLSLDINPLVHTESGFVAVDALCIVRDPPRSSSHE